VTSSAHLTRWARIETVYGDEAIKGRLK